MNLDLIFDSKFHTLYKNKFIKHKTIIPQKIEEKLWYLRVVKSLDLTPKAYPIKFVNLTLSKFKTIAYKSLHDEDEKTNYRLGL